MLVIIGVCTHACPPKRLCQVETRLVKSVSSIRPLARKLRSGDSTSDWTLVRLLRLLGVIWNEAVSMQVVGTRPDL